MASLIITASSTGPTLALNPLLTGESKAQVAQVQEYSVERPTSTSALRIYNEIIEASKRYGVDTDNALRIARCESHFRQYDDLGEPLRGVQNKADIGVFQINERYHLDQSQALGLNIYQTHGNIEYAMQLIKKETNKHWKWSKPCWTGERNLATN